MLPGWKIWSYWLVETILDKFECGDLGSRYCHFVMQKFITRTLKVMDNENSINFTGVREF